MTTTLNGITLLSDSSAPSTPLVTLGDFGADLVQSNFLYIANNLGGGSSSVGTSGQVQLSNGSGGFIVGSIPVSVNPTTGFVIAGKFTCGNQSTSAFIGNSSLDQTSYTNNSISMSAAGDVTINAASGRAGSLSIAGTQVCAWNSTSFNVYQPFTPPSYTVALLPIGSNGNMAFASNACNVGEITGSGTGCIVQYNSTLSQWCYIGTTTQVTS